MQVPNKSQTSNQPIRRDSLVSFLPWISTICFSSHSVALATKRHIFLPSWIFISASPNDVRIEFNSCLWINLSFILFSFFSFFSQSFCITSFCITSLFYVQFSINHEELAPQARSVSDGANPMSPIIYPLSAFD